jgi:site-specific DNA-methyltransferase (adenine-specific)
MSDPVIERIGDAVLYLGDCYTILPTLPPVDAVVTDPPYGVKLDTDSTRFSGGTAGHIGRKGNRIGSAEGAPIANDDKPFDPSFLTSYGADQIIWGWNNFPDKLPRGACLVWLKRHDEAFQSFLSDAETAWFSRGSGVYCRRDLSNNAIANHRVHPTQKPESLMAWCLTFVPKARSILDPFMGSGTTGVACVKAGLSFVGVEVERRYFDVACERITAAYAQGRLFA